MQMQPIPSKIPPKNSKWVQTDNKTSTYDLESVFLDSWLKVDQIH